MNDFYAPMLAAIDHAVSEGFVLLEHRQTLYSETNPERLLALMENHQHPHTAVRRWLKQHEE